MIEVIPLQLIMEQPSTNRMPLRYIVAKIYRSMDLKAVAKKSSRYLVTYPGSPKILETLLMITTSNVVRANGPIWHQFTPNDPNFDGNMYAALEKACMLIANLKDNF